MANTPKRSNEPHPKTHWLSAIRNKLIAGVLVAIPIVVTIWVLNVAYRFIKGISDPWLRKIQLVAADPASDYAGLTANQLPGVSFFVTLILLLLLGVMTTNVLGKKILSSFEKLLTRIPIVASVYTSVKQVIESIQSYNDVQKFKRVIYVDYPSEGCKLIGFSTGQYYDGGLECNMTSVVLPTSPNPMTGLLVVVPTDRVTDADLTMEEATKMLISAGLVVPKRQRAEAIAAGIQAAISPRP
jgi:uncharacterized membrane protein